MHHTAFPRAQLLLAALAAVSAGPPPKSLLIGASGGTGMRAIHGYLDGGVPASSVSVLTRSAGSDKAARLRAMGVGVVEGDLDDKGSIEEVLAEGWDAIYVHGLAGDTKQIDQRETARGELLGEAAASAAASGTPKPLVLYNSAAAPDGTDIPRIRQKRDVEAALAASPGFRAAAALRAHLFMEELWKAYTRPSIVGPKRAYPFAVPSDKPLCLTSVYDMGRVAARCAAMGATPPRVIDVVSDVRTPAELAAAFSASQGGEPVRHVQPLLLYWTSRLLLPELHKIIHFYRHTDFSPHFGARDDLRELLAGLELQTFDEFLEATRWADPERTFASLEMA